MNTPEDLARGALPPRSKQSDPRGVRNQPAPAWFQAELRRIASEAYALWDSDQLNDSKVGKLLSALAGVAGYRADIDALFAPPHVGWQPIDSAPTETPLLVFWLDGRLPQYATALHTNAPSMRGWWAFGSRLIMPTHWMPLPEAPVAKGSAREMSGEHPNGEGVLSDIKT